jgi:hypothetical protein
MIAKSVGKVHFGRLRLLTAITGATEGNLRMVHEQIRKHSKISYYLNSKFANLTFLTDTGTTTAVMAN